MLNEEFLVFLSIDFVQRHLHRRYVILQCVLMRKLKSLCMMEGAAKFGNEMGL